MNILLRSALTAACSLGCLFITHSSQAQVGIGTTSPNSNAKLEISATDKGFLPPRLALTSTDAASPLSGHVAGMVVYNTAASGSGGTAVTPGFYFNNGSQWLRLLSEADIQVTNKKAFGTISTALTVAIGRLEFRYNSNGAGGYVQVRTTDGSTLSSANYSTFIIENWTSGNSTSAGSSCSNITGTYADICGSSAVGTLNELNVIYLYDKQQSKTYRLTINLLTGNFESLFLELF
ncbi:hypothetical protein JMG10_07390 [Nostoc ellipsosporum NOK]|nr:hypothetical protein [Nostoc ellipsosporum NOK]